MAMDVSFHMLKENPVIVGADCPGTPIMSNHAIPHRADLTDAAESPTTETLVALAHAHRQGIPDEIGAQWLARLPERLRTLADWVLDGKMDGGEVAYAVAILIDSIEHAPGVAGSHRH